jgi:hypothetical protein
MLQSRGELDLLVESVEIDCGRELRRQDLDDDLPVKGRILSDEYARHSPATQLAYDGIGRYQCSLELFPKLARHGEQRYGLREDCANPDPVRRKHSTAPSRYILSLGP